MCLDGLLGQRQLHKPSSHVIGSSAIMTLRTRRHRD
jgi:hypothetical protein